MFENFDWRFYTSYYLDAGWMNPKEAYNDYLKHKNTRLPFYIDIFDDRKIEGDFEYRLNQTKKNKIVKGLWGINILGYHSGTFGLGENARAIERALKEIDVPYTINYLYCDGHSFSDKKKDTNNPYEINLVLFNHNDIIENVLKQLPRNYFKNKINIAVWVWELEKFPNRYATLARYYDEVWTHGEFSKRALISRISQVKSLTITPSVPQKIDDAKEFLKLQDKFIVLFIFDYHSRFERKNPLAVLDAFYRAFPSEKNVLLIFKTINSQNYPLENQKLTSKSDDRVKIINDVIPKRELEILQNACDVYISLHRSEGFGHTIFEAMSLGKPVIVTGYSGNMEYTNKNNSLLVSYKLTRVIDAYYGMIHGTWADPNIEEAAAYLRKLYQDKDYRRAMSKNIEIINKLPDQLKEYLQKYK